MIRSVVLGSVSALALALAAAGFGIASAQMQQQQQATEIDVPRGQKLAAEVCASCHGIDGNSVIPANPKLAGQHADYVAKQLYDFKLRPAEKVAPRPNPVMQGFATPLSDGDIRNVAAYYATQVLKPAFAANKELSLLGRKIYRAGIPEKNVPACAGCHGPTGAGIPAPYPRLAGQFAAYTAEQLVKFRAGIRANSVQMMQIAERMSDREIQAVSDYIAGLR